MKEMKKLLGSILLALTIPVALVAQMSPNDPAVGTWKLNVAKSKFSPGPAPKDSTVTIAEDNKVTVNGTGADGKDINYSLTPSEGTAVPVDGMEGTTMTQKKINDHTFEHTWTTGNTVMHGRAVISADGKTMRYTMTGTRADGKKIHNVEVYEKQ